MTEITEDDDVFYQSVGKYRRLADALGCRAYQVAEGFRELSEPTAVTALELRALSEAAKTYGAVAKHLRRALDEAKNLTEFELSVIEWDSGFTMAKLSDFVELFADTAEALKSMSSRHETRGGANPGAYVVAEGVARIFENSGRKITFGEKSDGGASGEFCRAVEVAIQVFEILQEYSPPEIVRDETGKAIKVNPEKRKFAHWKGPAQLAFKKRNRHDE